MTVTYTTPALRRVWIEAALVALVVLAAHLWLRLPSAFAVPGSFNDDGVYLSVGKSIAEGHGYRSLHFGGTPVHVKYPPGLPALWAIFWAVFERLDAVVAAARALNLALLAASVALLWHVGRARLALRPAPLLLLSIAPLALDATVQYYGLAVSEPHYVFWWAVALWIATDPRARDGHRAIVAATALGLVTAAATLFRSHGIALAGGFGLALLVARRPWREVAAYAGGSLLPLVAWKLAHAAMTRGAALSTVVDEGSYTEWLPVRGAALVPFLWNELGTNARAYDMIFGFYTTPTGVGLQVIPGSFMLLAVAGGALLVRHRPALVVPAAAALLLSLAWPWTQDRFVLPLLPFLGLLGAVAVTRLHAVVGPLVRRAGVAAAVLLAVALLANQRWIHREQFARAVQGREMLLGGHPTYFLPGMSRRVVNVARWLERNARPGDVALVDVPSGVYLMSGVRTSQSSPARAHHSPSPFGTPGRYLLTRVAEDGVTLVFTYAPSLGVLADLNFVNGRCPGSVTLAGHVARFGPEPVARLVPGDPCLAALARELGVPPARPRRPAVAAR